MNFVCSCDFIVNEILRPYMSVNFRKHQSSLRLLPSFPFSLSLSLSLPLPPHPLPISTIISLYISYRIVIGFPLMFIDFKESCHIRCPGRRYYLRPSIFEKGHCIITLSFFNVRFVSLIPANRAGFRRSIEASISSHVIIFQ